MAERVTRDRYLTPEEADHYDAIREEFAHCPTPEQLLASGEYVGPMSLEEYFEWRETKFRTSLVSQLKAAIESCGKSVNAIAKESGVSQAIIQRFLAGERDIRLGTASRLADYLRLDLLPRVPEPKR